MNDPNNPSNEEIAGLRYKASDMALGAGSALIGKGGSAEPKIVGLVSHKNKIYVATDSGVYALHDNSVQKVFDVGELEG